MSKIDKATPGEKIMCDFYGGMSLDEIRRHDTVCGIAGEYNAGKIDSAIRRAVGEAYRQGVSDGYCMTSYPTVFRNEKLERKYNMRSM